MILSSSLNRKRTGNIEVILTKISTNETPKLDFNTSSKWNGIHRNRTNQGKNNN